MAKVHSYTGMRYCIEQIWKSVEIALKTGLFKILNRAGELFAIGKTMTYILFPMQVYNRH